MSKYKYSKTEQQINNVLKYHDEELKKIKTEQPSMSELDSRIQESEDLLRMLGYTKMPILSKREESKRVMVVPSWEDLCMEAENAVGKGMYLNQFSQRRNLKQMPKKSVC